MGQKIVESEMSEKEVENEVEKEVENECLEVEELDMAVVPYAGASSDVISDASAVVHDTVGCMEIGECRFGVTCTGKPISTSHWLSDSMSCGDMVMALPSSVLIAPRTKLDKGVGVDMNIFLDAIVEGAARMEGLPGISEPAGIPSWAVSRLFGTFPALMAVYHEAMDQSVLTIEAAAMKAATFMVARNTRTVTKVITEKQGNKSVEVGRQITQETLDKEIAPDPALSKFIMTSRMPGRYKDMGGVKQAVVVNVFGAEADV
jgi:hypothetical protein